MDFAYLGVLVTVVVSIVAVEAIARIRLRPYTGRRLVPFDAWLKRTRRRYRKRIDTLTIVTVSNTPLIEEIHGSEALDAAIAETTRRLVEMCHGVGPVTHLGRGRFLVASWRPYGHRLGAFRIKDRLHRVITHGGARILVAVEVRSAIRSDRLSCDDAVTALICGGSPGKGGDPRPARGVARIPMPRAA